MNRRSHLSGAAVSPALVFALLVFAAHGSACSDSRDRDDDGATPPADASPSPGDDAATPPPGTPPPSSSDAGVDPPAPPPPSTPACDPFETVVATAEMAAIDNAAMRTPPRLVELDGYFPELGLLFEHHYTAFDERVPGSAVFGASGEPTRAVFWSLRGAPIRAGTYDGWLTAIVRDDDGRRLHFATSPTEGALVAAIDPGEGRVALDAVRTRDGWLSATVAATEDPFAGYGVLRIGRAERDGSAYAEADYDSWIASQLRDPQLVVGWTRAWLAVRTNIDFPYSVMLEEIDPETGTHIIERSYPWGPGCGVDSFHVIAANDEPVIVADCGGTTWLATNLESDAHAVQSIAEGTMPGSRVAWNGRELLVTTWRSGEPTPRVQLRALDGTARSEDVALPAATVVSGEPRGLDAVSLGIGPTWSVAFSVETEGGFAQAGTVYLARFRGCLAE